MNTRLKPGDFSCPLVWETDLPLHPRLKEPAVASQSNLGCRGLHVIRGFLNHNAIINRRNMFAYRDDCKNIFYFKISEIIQATQMISRASSVSSSVFDFGIEDASKQRPDDRIELKVYGISEVGRNIKNDLIAGLIFYARNRTRSLIFSPLFSVLQKMLNDKVVEILSQLLLRNPMCKLTPEDVIFLQKPNSNPSKVVKFKLHSASEVYLEALQYYLRQNIVHQFATVPKYHSQRFIFRDVIEAAEVSGADIFLYNNSTAGGRRGLAVFSMSIVDCHGKMLHSSKKGRSFFTLFLSFSYYISFFLSFWFFFQK